MSEKSLRRRALYEEPPPKPFQIRRRRTWLAVALLLAASGSTLYLLDSLPPFSASSRKWVSQKTSEFQTEIITKVPLEAHIMQVVRDGHEALANTSVQVQVSGRQRLSSRPYYTDNGKCFR